MLRVIVLAALTSNFGMCVKSLRNRSTKYVSWGLSSNERSNFNTINANASLQVTKFAVGDRPKIDEDRLKQLQQQLKKTGEEPDRMKKLKRLHEELNDMVAKSVGEANVTMNASNRNKSPHKPDNSTTPSIKDINHSSPQEANASRTNASEAKVSIKASDVKAKAITNIHLINDISYPPTWALPNAVCLPHTGRRCRDGKSCSKTAQCSEDKWCVCPTDTCADGSAGGCDKSGNKWLGAEFRLSPRSRPTEYFVMATDEASPPYLVSGWPDRKNSEAIWDFLVEPDSISVLVATVWARDNWHGRFVDLNESSSFAVLQRQPFDAVQAAFNVVLMPEDRIAFRHIRTGLYLFFDQKAHRLSACASPDCPEGMAEFDVHPTPKSSGGPCFLCENPYRLALNDAFSYEKSTFLRPFQSWGK